VVEVAINDDAPIAIERDALGRTTREQLSAQVQRQFQYDGRSLLTAQTVLRDAAPLFETTYDYDRAGNLTHRRDSAQGVDEYRYDVLGRLLQHTDPKGRIERFFNDPAGDRLATRVQQVQLRKVAGGDDDQQVQWTREGSYAGVHYVFDRAGDLIRKGSPAGPEPDDLELLWDANHRLAESRKAGQTTHYGYDPLGRRVFKRNPTHTTWFYWDGDALLGEVKQAHDEPDAAPVWVGNVADLIEAKRRKEKLAKLHERTREYVYYPGTFVPLALVKKELRTGNKDGVPIDVRTTADAAASAVNIASTTSSTSAPAAKPDEPKASAAPVERDALPAKPLGVLSGVVQLRGSVPVALRASDENKPDSRGNGLGMLSRMVLGGGAVYPASSASSQGQSSTASEHSGAQKDAEQQNGISFALWRGSGERKAIRHEQVSAFEAFASSAAETPNVARVEELEAHLSFASEWKVTVYHYHVDTNGRPSRLTDNAGRVVWAIAMEAWGCAAKLLISDVESPIRFQGQYYDTETDLHYNRHRYYDPATDEFISQDPLRWVAGENFYRYAPNHLVWTDALGLDEARFPNWMETRQGYQRQHLVPYSLRDHDFMRRTGMDINGASNMMYLPVEPGIDPNPSKGLHRGWTAEHAQYNKIVGRELDKLERRALTEGWDYRRAQREAIALQIHLRRGLSDGTYTCASPSVRKACQ
ncbi:RHS repeat-associated core domain-containing protein, partial [Xanthomonas translucens]|uniref:RHS repeat-associated core domain-containing protein n=1 Tax=Xanthomonas campestris pv. translucens TaxID=343 RepID=UPI0018C281A0